MVSKLPLAAGLAKLIGNRAVSLSACSSLRLVSGIEASCFFVASNRDGVMELFGTEINASSVSIVLSASALNDVFKDAGCMTPLMFNTVARSVDEPLLRSRADRAPLETVYEGMLKLAKLARDVVLETAGTSIGSGGSASMVTLPPREIRVAGPEPVLN